MLKTGIIIAERYEILGKIGTGGMADVYKAKDHKLNRYVAVKVLKPEFREDTTFIRKFKSEAQAAAGLTHPNIVNVFDVGDDEGVYYIVMELIEGITLKEYITKKGKLSIKEATSIAIQVSMGLEAAHNHGIVHRDVKPQNIIISTDGKVKVTDFGIARAASSNTISSNVMGSVHYSSPEQVRGGYSDEKSDIYSLGITLYEMVTGRVPFDGDTTVAIAIKHLQEEMVAPSVYAPELPYSLEQIILKCTQKSVDRRYGEMEEVISDLKHSLIDPQGDFVKLHDVDTDAKTVVISDRELGEIKHTPKTGQRVSSPDVDEEDYDIGYGYDDEEDEEDYRGRRKQSGTKKSKNKKNGQSGGRGLSILAFLASAVLLVVLILVIGRASGLFGVTQEEQSEEDTTVVSDSADEDGLVEVPDLLGKSQTEATALANASSLGVQLMGEEASTQAAGNVSSQSPSAGERVAANTTIQYYISTGSTSITIPDLDGYTGIDAEQVLTDLGLAVTVTKAYSEADSNGYALVDPGYVSSTSPEEGSSVEAGSAVTLVVSRGLDYGTGVQVEVPSVVGMTQNEALTTLGKFLNVTTVEQASAEVEAGRVISQSPEAYSSADPDTGVITITVSTGTESAVTDTTTDTTDTTTADTGTSSGGVWKCTQQLDTPVGYQGGAIRLELVQEVNGESVATTVLDGVTVTFPYQLDITGASGVSSGTLYLSELVNGTYEQLGYYPITFEQAE